MDVKKIRRWCSKYSYWNRKYVSYQLRVIKCRHWWWVQVEQAFFLTSVETVTLKVLVPFGNFSKLFIWLHTCPVLLHMQISVMAQDSVSLGYFMDVLWKEKYPWSFFCAEVILRQLDIVFQLFFPWSVAAQQDLEAASPLLIISATNGAHLGG